jgi:hypothetical protein
VDADAPVEAGCL